MSAVLKSPPSLATLVARLRNLSSALTDILCAATLLAAVVLLPAQIGQRDGVSLGDGSGSRASTTDFISTPTALRAAVQRVLAGASPVVAIGEMNEATLVQVLAQSQLSEDMVPRRLVDRFSYEDAPFRRSGPTEIDDELMSKLIDFTIEQLKSPAVSGRPVTVYAPTPEMLYERLVEAYTGFLRSDNGLLSQDRRETPIRVTEVRVPFPSRYQASLAALKAMTGVSVESSFRYDGFMVQNTTTIVTWLPGYSPIESYIDFFYASKRQSALQALRKTNPSYLAIKNRAASEPASSRAQEDLSETDNRLPRLLFLETDDAFLRGTIGLKNTVSR